MSAASPSSPQKKPSLGNSLLSSVQTPAGRMPSAPPTASDDDVRSISVGKILPRASADVRDLKPEHVLAMAESIDAIGLLQSIAIDSQKKLLAGKHRLAGCQLLAGLRQCHTPRERVALFDKIIGHETGDRFALQLTALKWEGFTKHHPGDAIPCRIMPFSAEADPDAALKVEITENEKRRDFTKPEVERLVEQLKSRGYTDRPGRPSAGEKPLNPALALLIGKSTKTVQRMLADKPKPQDPQVPQPTISHLPALLKALEKALPELQAARSPKLKAVLPHAEATQEALKAFLDAQ